MDTLHSGYSALDISVHMSKDISHSPQDHALQPASACRSDRDQALFLNGTSQIEARHRWMRPGDGAALEALLSPSYTHTDVFGAFQERAAWLAYARRRAGRTTRIAFRDVRTRIVGDPGSKSGAGRGSNPGQVVAIVTGLNEVSGPGGRSADDRTTHTLRFTQVWVWTDGR